MPMSMALRHAVFAALTVVVDVGGTTTWVDVRARTEPYAAAVPPSELVVRWGASAAVCCVIELLNFGLRLVTVEGFGRELSKIGSLRRPWHERIVRPDRSGCWWEYQCAARQPHRRRTGFPLPSGQPPGWTEAACGASELLGDECHAWYALCLKPAFVVRGT